MRARRFVKAYSTDVPVSRSQVQLQETLRRYGATGFGVHQDYATGNVQVFFRVPDEFKSETLIPVRLEVSTEPVFRALFHRSPPSYQRENSREWQQAERVAWRQLLLWVDAALSAASAGVQKISEAFLAHTLVQGSDGKARRVVDQMDEAAGGNWRALLAAPKEGA